MGMRHGGRGHQVSPKQVRARRAAGIQPKRGHNFDSRLRNERSLRLEAHAAKATIELSLPEPEMQPDVAALITEMVGGFPETIRSDMEQELWLLFLDGTPEDEVRAALPAIRRRVAEMEWGNLKNVSLDAPLGPDATSATLADHLDETGTVLRSRTRPSHRQRPDRPVGACGHPTSGIECQTCISKRADERRAVRAELLVKQGAELAVLRAARLEADKARLAARIAAEQESEALALEAIHQRHAAARLKEGLLAERRAVRDARAELRALRLEEQRVARNLAREANRTADLMKAIDCERAAEEAIELRQAEHRARITQMRQDWKDRHEGAVGPRGFYVDKATRETARRMVREGASLRRVAAETGIARNTVSRIIGAKPEWGTDREPSTELACQRCGYSPSSHVPSSKARKAGSPVCERAVVKCGCGGWRSVYSIEMCRECFLVQAEARRSAIA